MFAPPVLSLPIVDPPPGPGGCSVDIVNREAGTYTPGTVAGSIHFAYDLAARSCPGSLYGLIVLNSFDRRQVALYAQRGDGRSDKVTYDVRLPFVPTGSSTAPHGTDPGAGLCVIGFTLGQGRLQDVAPDQSPNLATALANPVCSPLLTGLSGGARAFH